MTPLILAIAAGVVLVIGVGIMIALRSRGEDEGARFRHVADLTSTWSRQSGDSGARSRQSGDSGKSSRPTADAETGTPRPLPYPESNPTQSEQQSESDVTTSGRPRTSGR